MTWVGYIALSTVAHSISVLIQRVLVQENKEHPIAFIVFYQILVGIIVLAYGFLRGFLSFPLETIAELWLPLLLAFALYACAGYFIFISLERIPASNFTIALSSRIFFTAIAAWILLGESLSLIQCGGAALIFTGIVVASFSSRSKVVDTSGLLFAVLAAVFSGLANVNDRFILQSMEVHSYTGLSFLGVAVIFAIFQTKKLVAGRSLLRPQPFVRIALFAAVYAIATLTFYIALQIGESASQVVSVSLVSVIVTVLFAMIFLKEREHPYQKILGAVLSFIGVLLLV